MCVVGNSPEFTLVGSMRASSKCRLENDCFSVGGVAATSSESHCPAKVQSCTKEGRQLDVAI